MKLIINTDGGARGNPGHGAAGYVVKDDSGRVLIKSGCYLGVTTNNDAEYQAITKALGAVLQKYHQVEEIEIKADSLLVIKQLNNEFKVKNNHLRELFDQIKTQEKGIKKITYTHIPREQNYQADLLVNQALDKLLT